MTSTFPDGRVVQATERATQHLLDTIQRDLGTAGSYLCDWLTELVGETGIAAAFLARRSHPLAHLPVWAADSADGVANEDLVEDLAYSSMNGYFFIRLIDDVMDADALGGEARLLPGLALLHTEFADVYHRMFPRNHPFWDLYRREWMGTAEAAISDAHAEAIDHEFFSQVTARKTRALLIPVAATLYLLDRDDLIEPWARVIRPFGAWQQYYNDFFGWTKDASHGAETLILSESRRESVDRHASTRWIWKHGVEWSRGVLGGFEVATRRATDDVVSKGLDEYFDWRFAEAARRLDMVEGAIQTILPGQGTG